MKILSAQFTDQTLISDAIASLLENSDPVAVTDYLEVPVDGSITFNFLDNDYDPDGDPLELVSVLPGGFFRDPSGMFENPNEPVGVFAYGSGNGEYVYTPGAEYIARFDPDTYRAQYIEYAIVDDNGGYAPGQAYITVVPSADYVMGPNDDFLTGTIFNDTLNGGNGNDFVRGGRRDDLLLGGNDDDVVRGGAGDDIAKGGNGDDIVRGGSGSDDVHGGFGDDSVFGGASDDTVNGGSGTDFLAGGQGLDVFVFDGIWGADAGSDTVKDFEDGIDTLRVLNVDTVSVRDSADGAVLDMSSGGSMTLRGVAASDIDGSDFSSPFQHIVYDLG